MDFYIYNQNVPLGTEKLGTEGRAILRNCTIKKVKNLLKARKYTEYSVYSFTNFYNDSTFKKLKYEKESYTLVTFTIERTRQKYTFI
jgi:hypothetical protein